MFDAIVPHPPSKFLSAHEYDAHVREMLNAAINRGDILRTDLTDALGMDRDKLAGRLRGKTGFSAYEVALLRVSYGLEVPVVHQDSQATGQLRFEVPTSFAFNAEQYFGGLATTAASVRRAIAAGRECDLKLLASDIPITALFDDPLLVEVKLYFFELAKFSTGSMPTFESVRGGYESYVRTCQDFAAAYQSVDSQEVWGGLPFGSFVGQLAYVQRLGFITVATADQIRERLLERITEIGDWLNVGHKPGGGRFALFENDVHAMSSTMLLRLGTDALSFLTIANPLYAHSTDVNTYRRMLNIFELQKRKSTSCGGDGSAAHRDWIMRMRARLA